MSDISTISPLIEKLSVNLRGWDFPHIDPRLKCVVDVDWVGQESQWKGFLESWRAYQSGQFVDYTAMEEDWSPQQSVAWGLKAPEKFLSIGNAIFTFTEILEFASRLALSPMGAEEMSVSTRVAGLSGRQLWINSGKRLPLVRPYVASLQELPFNITLKREELMAEAWSIARQWCSELLKRFGMEISDDSLREWQAELKSFRG